VINIPEPFALDTETNTGAGIHADPAEYLSGGLGAAFDRNVHTKTDLYTAHPTPSEYACDCCP